jgi:hypothetical protein
MSPLWCSRILNTQDIVGASVWYHGNFSSGDTSPPIEATEEEDEDHLWFEDWWMVASFV